MKASFRYKWRFSMSPASVYIVHRRYTVQCSVVQCTRQLTHHWTIGDSWSLELFGSTCDILHCSRSRIQNNTQTHTALTLTVYCSVSISFNTICRKQNSYLLYTNSASSSQRMRQSPSTRDEMENRQKRTKNNEINRFIQLFWSIWCFKFRRAETPEMFTICRHKHIRLALYSID